MVTMFERFRKKSSTKNETTENVAATLAELEIEVEAESVTSGDEIEQARQDLMRAAMEAITIPAPKAESELATSAPPKSDDADIPVIQVKITRPTTPIPAPKPKPPTPPQAAEPAAKIEPLAPSEPVESTPSPVEPAIDEQKTPESPEGETAADESPEIVPLRSDALVVKHEPPETKETTGLEEQLIEEREDIPEDEIIAQIAPENELLSSRVMVFADAENTDASVENLPAEIPLESPASEIPPDQVSFPASPGEQPDEPRIAQLDDIMIDIVKQDIASHRRRIYQPN